MCVTDPLHSGQASAAELRLITAPVLVRGKRIATFVGTQVFCPRLEEKPRAKPHRDSHWHPLLYGVGSPAETLHAQNDASGVQINARTGMPGWQGERERFDVGWAISVLHPLAQPDA